MSGYQVWVAGPCGVTFRRQVTAGDALIDLAEFPQLARTSKLTSSTIWCVGATSRKCRRVESGCREVAEARMRGRHRAPCRPPQVLAGRPRAGRENRLAGLDGPSLGIAGRGRGRGKVGWTGHALGLLTLCYGAAALAGWPPPEKLLIDCEIPAASWIGDCIRPACCSKSIR